MAKTTFFGGLLALLAAAASLAAASEPTAERSAAETKARAELAGLWKGYVVMGRGEKPNEGPVNLELTISAERIAGIQLQQAERIDHGAGEYALDLGAAPRVLDGVKTNERGRKDIWLGIYALEGDTLKWCVKKKERPESFESGAGQFYMILRREKP